MNGRTLALALAAALGTAAPAAAQIGHPLADALTVGGAVGFGAIGASGSSSTAPGLAVHLDMPLQHRFRGRLTAGTHFWEPPRPSWPPDAEAPPAGRLSRVTVSALRHAFEPTHRYPFTFYAGGGVGWYYYALPGASRRVNGGLHGTAGTEFIVDGARSVIRLEVELHVLGGPRHPQVPGVGVTSLALSLGVSRRF